MAFIMNSMRSGLFLMCLGLTAASRAVVLYDSSTGLLPDNAPWNWSYGTTGGDVVANNSGVLDVDTRPNSLIQAGWGRLSPVALDATTGATIGFRVWLHAETHPGGDVNGDGLSDRAGFSFIALCSDKKGIELSLWNDEVWVQQDTPLFTHSQTADRAFRNNNTAFTDFEISFLGNGYTVKANGSTILNGTRKDYTAFGGFPDPYETPNFLFFGDDTSSAGASYSLTNVTVNAVPEPATLTALAIGAAALIKRRRR